MTHKYIIANWKLKLSLNESKKLARSVIKKIPKKLAGKEVILCPCFTALESIQKIIKKSQIKLGAQNIFWEDKGAFTGEISGYLLKELGVEYVIIGHSERRQYLLENDKMIHLKIKSAIDEGLTPILCVGETFEQRKEGSKDYVIQRQIVKALEGISTSLTQKIIIAYEPVWVIGSGQAVDPKEAEYTHKVIRQTLIDLFPISRVVKNFPIIYGGSVDSSNANSFLKQETVHGVLIGGASLDADEFAKIVQIYSQ